MLAGWRGRNQDVQIVERLFDLLDIDLLRPHLLMRSREIRHIHQEAHHQHGASGGERNHRLPARYRHGKGVGKPRQ